MELDRNTMEEIGLIHWGNSGMNARTYIEDWKRRGYVVLIEADGTYASIFRPKKL